MGRPGRRRERVLLVDLRGPTLRVSPSQIGIFIPYCILHRIFKSTVISSVRYATAGRCDMTTTRIGVIAIGALAIASACTGRIGDAGTSARGPNGGGPATGAGSGSGGNATGTAGGAVDPG